MEFQKFVDGNLSRLIGMAVPFVKDESLAKDCVQETLIKVWKSRDRFRGESSFATWVGQVLSHTCIDTLRRLKRERIWCGPINGYGGDSGRPQPREFVASRGDEPDRRAEVNDLERHLFGAIAELPPSQASVLRRLVQGESPLAIAVDLGIPLASVRTRLYYGRRKLRQKLTCHPYVEDIGV